MGAPLTVCLAATGIFVTRPGRASRDEGGASLEAMAGALGGWAGLSSLGLHGRATAPAKELRFARGCACQSNSLILEWDRFILRASAPAVCVLVFLAPFACGGSRARDAGDAGDSGLPPDTAVNVREPAVHPVVQVTKNANDNAGTGMNREETFLNVTNVKAATFGKLFTLPVDGDQFAQPLYMGALKMGDGKTHNVVFVATENDSVYAYDADVASTTPLWHASLGSATPIPNPWFSGVEWGSGFAICANYNLRQSGITATPVIDPASGTMYVVAIDIDTSHTTAGTCLNVNTCSTYACNDVPTTRYKLHALDLASGAEKLGGPVIIGGTIDGAGLASTGGKITFDATVSLVRAAPFLANGTVYIATGSYGDQGDYHGWFFTYDAENLHQTGVFNTTPNGQRGAIWQSGRGAVADTAGNVYVVTSNGTFDVNTGGDDWGNCVLRFGVADTKLQKPADYFSPFLSDYQGTNYLDEYDDDLGSAGGTLIPGTSLLLASGKLGIGYLLDTNHLGEWNATSDAVVQKMRITWLPTETACKNQAQVYGTPVVWTGPDGTHVYVWGNGDYLRDYLLDGNGMFQDSGRLCFCDPSVVDVSMPIDVSDPNCAEPQSVGTVSGGNTSAGAALSISSNGSEAGTGILWTTHTAMVGDAIHHVLPGSLDAYDATNVSKPLWTSEDNAARDALGNWAKFTPPTIANGKVYAPTFSKALVVYGLLPP
jgi:hypothetical protein